MRNLGWILAGVLAGTVAGWLIGSGRRATPPAGPNLDVVDMCGRCLAVFPVDVMVELADETSSTVDGMVAGTVVSCLVCADEVACQSRQRQRAHAELS